jgi:hypothetical protein
MASATGTLIAEARAIERQHLRVNVDRFTERLNDKTAPSSSVLSQ